MAGRRPTAVPAARTTLRRLRLVLTIAFTVTNAAGLLLFAWLAIHFDAVNGRDELDAQLNITTRSALQHIKFDNNGVIALSGLNGQSVTKDGPAFDVLPGSGKPFVGREFGTKHRVTAPLAQMNQMAWLATESNQIVRNTVTDGHGHTLRILAEPLGPTGAGAQAEAAVVAVADADPVIATHERTEIATTIACAIIIFGLGLFGHLISVRAMRPAANALDQQELFLAESAHDLRTPVAALRAITETAMDNPEQRSMLLPRAVSLTKRMSDILDDLMIRARLASGVEQLNLQPVRLDQLVAGLIEELPDRGDGAHVSFTSAPSTVAADYPLLRRAIGNLVDNARKYGHRVGEEAYVEVDVRDGRVIVADHGPGMHAEMSATPFARRNRSSPDSSGLGLPIVRWVADAHRGTLGVHNRTDGGAVFELTLPPI